MTNNDEQIALYIDAENVNAKYADEIMERLAHFGTLRSRKAYANWESKKGNVRTWHNDIMIEHSIRKVQKDTFASKSNGSDILIAIDVMKALCRNQNSVSKITHVALVTSDSDFTPLVDEIIAQGIKVIGFGEHKLGSKDALRNACTVYFELGEKQEQQAHLSDNNDLIYQLKRAVNLTADEDGWALISKVGNFLKKKTSESYTNHGNFQSWGALYKHLEEHFEVSRRDPKNPSTMIVRVKY
jgi:uncharacterized LabA/DUF88 family protein